MHEACGHTVIDTDGIEEPCEQPLAGWRYYEGCVHEDMLLRVCAEHQQAELTEAIAARDAQVAARALRGAVDALKSDAMEWHAEDMRDHSGEPSDCECSEEGLCHEYARFTALHGRAPIWLRDRADRIERGGESEPA